MKTITIDQSSVLIPSLITFISGKHIKNKNNPLSDPEDVETFGNILISRISNILCNVADPGDLVVVCMDKKDSDSKYWRHRLSNRVSDLYKLNRDSSLFDSVDKDGLEEAKNKYLNWCADNAIRVSYVEGFEADDIIAELVCRAPQAVIISPDGDFNQLITSPNVIRIDPIRYRAYRCKEDDSDWFGVHSMDGIWADAILKTLEITDISLINANFSLLIKILMGDSSDCIPSVHTHMTKTGKAMGVGKKTAEKMILSVFSDISSVKHYNDLSVAEKTLMCSVLKDADIKDVLKRMDENADMVILHNKKMNEWLNPVIALVDDIYSSSSKDFAGVQGVSVREAANIVMQTLTTPEEFSDYDFD